MLRVRIDFNDNYDLVCSMEKVTITKKEHNKLLAKAKAYEKLAGIFFENVVKDPIDDIMLDFRKTGKYSNDLLQDLEKGLGNSSYFRKR